MFPSSLNSLSCAIWLALGAPRSLSLLLLFPRGDRGSAEVGVGIFGGPMAFDFPFAWCEDSGADSLFSLSDENDAAGEGDSEPGFAPRALLGRLMEFVWISSSSSSGRGLFARRAIVEEFLGSVGKGCFE